MLRPTLLAAVVLVAASSLVAPPAEAATTCAGHRVTIQGGSGNDHINGTSHADVIDAGAGDDIVNGLGGNDIICGGPGADDLRGNAGNDRVYGGLDGVRSERIYSDNCSIEPPYYCVMTWLVGDTLRGGTGNDLLVPGWDTRHSHQGGSATSTAFPPYPPNISSYPSNTFDELRWDTSASGVRVNLTKQWAAGEGTDTIVAAGRFDVVTSAHADTVVGTNGPDFIRTGAASDTVFARDGDDYVELDSSGSKDRDADIAHGGPGNDYLRAGTGPDQLYGEDGDDRLLDEGLTKADRTYGGAGDDVLADVLAPIAGQVADGGGDAGDVFWPNLLVGGNATWSMTPGSMMFSVPSATTVLAAGFHEFRYLGHYTTTWDITGTDQADTVHAPGEFNGGNGDDWYEGGSGADTFNGGVGSDRYGDDGGGTNTCTSVELDPHPWCATNTP